ncbi:MULTISPECIES: hypothetical protein [Actinomadura]|uniref:Uncharacterized protein n=1 Tax=Actinomadura yumaensis TaxID=111807 RepID=A0ABW2CR69_9ACTN|nr:hypothetical protein [Actinomadura sp. J1-007]
MAAHTQPRDCGPVDLNALAAVPSPETDNHSRYCTRMCDLTYMCDDYSTQT